MRCKIFKNGGKAKPKLWVDATIVYNGKRYFIVVDDNGKEYSVRKTKKGLRRLAPIFNCQDMCEQLSGCETENNQSLLLAKKLLSFANELL